MQTREILPDRHFEIDRKTLTNAGTFGGYGSVYGVVDMGDDIVSHDAFSESLATWNAKGKMPALLWQHHIDEPLGRYTRMVEDDKGLYVEGKFTLAVPQAKAAYELLKDGALDGLSIGFMTRDDSYDQKTGIRTIKKADLWEVSLVTFGMNEQAVVDSVKDANFETVSDVERWLRDVARLSKNDAKTLTSKVLTVVRRDVAAKETSQAILAALRARAEVLRA